MAANHMMECERELGGCGFRFSVLPGWRVVRRLQQNERSEPPNGTVWCQECRSKWLVAPAVEQREAA